jgi:predicted neuraminidase
MTMRRSGWGIASIRRLWGMSAPALLLGGAVAGAPLFAAGGGTRFISVRDARESETARRSANAGRSAAAEAPFLKAELIFPLEHWHNHASCIVETPEGDLLVCWFHGSGERQADDVSVLGARRRRGSETWSQPFVMADTPGYPDTNPAMFIDPEKRLWLFWPTILANEWETALMKYKRATHYQQDGPPQWDTSEVLHVTPDDRFKETVERVTAAWKTVAPAAPSATTAPAGASPSVASPNASSPSSAGAAPAAKPTDVAAYADRLVRDAGDKLKRRLGWMTRAHPYLLDGSRLIVPLYSDCFSFSLMAFTDDWGKTWSTSTPLVGAGNIQPSLARRKDGTLVTYMRDNGPAPKRLMTSSSSDRAATWSPVVDTAFPNPGSGAEVLALNDGHWVLIYNDLERGRYQLAVSLSDDEGRTWPWTRHLERDAAAADPQQLGEYHYPSIMQASDGTLHASYSYFLPVARAQKDAQDRSVRKSIKHAQFNEAWIRQGDRP